ncbi:hypothetical protein CLOSTHATH_04405 [Hungatella hathewayi DSM 13479]|uniref:Uncharacterized protein n=1 Tax=Hungatella hathewayi DSM 13479 TaxID=566550 RepID=D3ALA9_9FIRM|nr:hypothetical protein CLOSTHATH_04405 [Hungatella hathewayi DSM 13479]
MSWSENSKSYENINKTARRNSALFCRFRPNPGRMRNRLEILDRNARPELSIF